MIKEFRLSPAPPSNALLLRTCERRERYLAQTLESFREAGGDFWPGPRIVIADGYDPRDDKEYNRLLKNWTVEPSKERLYAANTLMRALIRAGDLTGVERVTHLEDDVVFSVRAIDYMTRSIFDPDFFFVAFFTLYPAPLETDLLYWRTIKMREYARAQAFSQPIDCAKRVVADWDKLFKLIGVGMDLAFARYWPEEICAILYPNIVQHIGGVSMVPGQPPFQKSPSFRSIVKIRQL